MVGYQLLWPKKIFHARLLSSSPNSQLLRLAKLHLVCRNPRLTETMFAMRLKLIRQALSCACLLFFFVTNLQSDTRPLPEDLGAIHLAQLLTKLKTTARLMQTTAHP